MKDNQQTIAQLSEELAQLSRQLAGLEAVDTKRKRAEAQRAAVQDALRRSVENAAYSQRYLLALSQAARNVQRARNEGLTEADVPSVTTFASQAAIALENARLLQETKQAAENLRKSQERFRLLFDHGFDAIVIQDGTGRVIDANRSVRRLLGYSEEELVTLSAKDLHPNEEKTKTQTAARPGSVLEPPLEPPLRHNEAANRCLRAPVRYCAFNVEMLVAGQ